MQKGFNPSEKESTAPSQYSYDPSLILPSPCQTIILICDNNNAVHCLDNLVIPSALNISSVNKI